jgi:hypothetical protein
LFTLACSIPKLLVRPCEFIPTFGLDEIMPSTFASDCPWRRPTYLGNQKYHVTIQNKLCDTYRFLNGTLSFDSRIGGTSHIFSISFCSGTLRYWSKLPCILVGRDLHNEWEYFPFITFSLRLLEVIIIIINCAFKNNLEF